MNDKSLFERGGKGGSGGWEVPRKDKPVFYQAFRDVPPLASLCDAPPGVPIGTLLALTSNNLDEQAAYRHQFGPILSTTPIIN